MTLSTRLAAQLARATLMVVAITGLFGTPSRADGEARLLAPSGTLRVGVYPGSPTSMVTDGAGNPHGLAYDLGGELAKRLGIPVDYIKFDRVADIVSAIHTGQVDFTVTNATPVRANDVSFSQTVLAIEFGFLVPANSPIGKAEEIDKTGIRIGVTKGSTSERALTTKFKHVTIVPAESVNVAIAMFDRGEIDLYATNKPTLYAMSDRMPGSHILDGNWGLEHMAIAIPRWRADAIPLLNNFVTDELTSGAVDVIQLQAGIRGAVKATRY